ncbi:MAG TPA: ABC transporter permease/substrate-binding protein [Pyrinomonadaceae bacterium]|nr:ABC transporter permease/substrate-binding protein [Pyrinomonadaceae bacterium]
MNFLEFLQQNYAELFALTREHVFLVFVSTFFAVLIGLPLGVLLTRFKSLQTPVLGVANILQTIPSLALFGLLIPIAYIGGIGAKTAIIALTLYSFLPIIRNTVTGISGVDSKVGESATAMGMTDWQILRQVELPLAAPVILTGIRVAVVISVGVATIAAAVGAGGLGTYIFRGLRQNDNNLLLAGAICSALLALIADFALGRIEKLFAPVRAENRGSSKRRKFIAVGAFGLIAVLLGLSFILNFKSGISNSTSETASQTIRVGSKDFTESVILSEILAQMLEKRGFTVEKKFELGGNLAHDALLSNQIDVYPEYTGTAFTAILKHQPITDSQAVYDQTKAEYAEKFNLVLSPSLGFSNDFAILVRGDVARKMNLKTISDAVPISKNWQAGFGQDFMSRADGYAGFSRVYNFDFSKQPREMDLSLTYRALAAGEVDLIAGNSTDGLIAALDLFQLADDRRYFPPYQAVFIARRDKSEILNETFERLNGAISTEEMRRLNYAVDGDKRAPKEAASSWIKEKGF